MRIGDLINNPEFSFNVPFRILEYIGTPEDPDKTLLMYDSESTRPFPESLGERWISAINQGDDGVMEIEYIVLIGEEN